MSPHLFAGVRVRAFAEARTWYERLLGYELGFGGARVDAP